MIRRIRNRGMITAGIIYVQFILGALLRHFGMGVDIGYASLHVIWGMVALVAIGVTGLTIRIRLWDDTPLRRSAAAMMYMVIVQIALGFLAFAVLMEERGTPESLTQVWLNSSHLVVGALVMASVISVIAFTLRAAPEPAS